MIQLSFAGAAGATTANGGSLNAAGSISRDQRGAEQLLGCGANLNRHSGRSWKLIRTRLFKKERTDYWQDQSKAEI